MLWSAAQCLEESHYVTMMVILEKLVIDYVRWRLCMINQRQIFVGSFRFVSCAKFPCRCGFRNDPRALAIYVDVHLRFT